MKQFDNYIFEHISQEDIPMPANYRSKIEATLDSLPEQKTGRKLIPLRRWVSAAAAFVFVFLMLLPNASPAYAQALENVPVLGALAEVFTLRNYFHADDRTELDAQLPVVSVPEAPEAQDQLNAQTEALVNATVDRFYQELESQGTGHNAVSVDYRVITNTGTWFTLELAVEEIAASGHVQLRYYHIDRASGKYVTFGDLFTEEGYAAIEAQLLAQMAGNNDYILEDVQLLRDDQSFFFQENGDLVIVYGEAEIAPAYMGNPTFTIAADVFSPYWK